MSPPEIQWQKTYGGSLFDQANLTIQTTDGGYIIAGSSASNDWDVTNSRGNADYWIVKLDSGGAIQWKQCYGGSGWDYASNIQPTNDGGYIVAGSSYSGNGDVTYNHGGGDYWIAKLTFNSTPVPPGNCTCCCCNTTPVCNVTVHLVPLSPVISLGGIAFVILAFALRKKK